MSYTVINFECTATYFYFQHVIGKKAKSIYCVEYLTSFFLLLFSGLLQFSPRGVAVSKTMWATKAGRSDGKDG